MKFRKNQCYSISLRKRPHHYVKVLLLFTIPIGIIYIIFVINYLEKTQEDNLNYYQDKDDDLEIDSFPEDVTLSVENLIHIDLKGAPPKIRYLKKFIPFIKTLGATGILIEYEDMFPYYGELENITALNAYTPSDIETLIQTVEDNNLTLVPFIPTFNHLEFILKLEQYKQFREVESDPQVICPSKRKIYAILKKMIDQILEAHSTSEFVHIGCDDVQSIGVCAKCQKVLREKKWQKDHIFFRHVHEIAEYIITKYPAVQPIVWGNKFLKKNEKIIIFHKLPEMVDVMLMNPENELYPGRDDMLMLTNLFSTLWIASSFKGTFRSTQIVTNIQLNLRHSREWLGFTEVWKNLTTFKGIALIGWQRFNHFSVLSELLPVGIPCMVSNLKYFLNFNSIKAFDYEELKETLKCSHYIPSNLYEIKNLKLVSSIKCNFPGFKIYKIIHLFYNVLLNMMSSLEKIQTPDFTFYNIVHNTSNPSRVHGLNPTIYKLKLLELDDLQNEMRVAMHEIYDEYTISEWITTYIMPAKMRLEAVINIIGGIRDIKKVWPRRPFLNSETQLNTSFNKICNKGEVMGCAIFNILAFQDPKLLNDYAK